MVSLEQKPCTPQPLDSAGDTGLSRPTAHTRLRAGGVVTSSGYGPSAVAFNIFGPVSDGASGQDVLLSGVPDGYPRR